MKFGYIYDWKETEKFLASSQKPLFSTSAQPLRGSGKDQVRLLHKCVKDVIDYFPVHNQTVGDCFGADTIIYGPQEKRIQHIKVGDLVYTAQGKTTKVISTNSKVNPSLLKISLTKFGFPTVYCTEDHKLLVNNKWVRADALRTSDKLMQPTPGGYIDLPIFKMEKINNFDQNNLVYDIGVEDEHHSVIANGVAASNCVSQAFGLGVDVVKAVEIYTGESESFEAETATEALYALARVEIGGGRVSGDGAYGGWGARAVMEYGTLLRRVYGNHDLRKYSGQKARAWGRTGLPDELEPTSKEHRIKAASLVTSYEDARDAIYNGYPVVVCSSQGFSSRRDSEGFADPQGTWYHAMLFMGSDDKYRRPGLLCANSWGNWNSGPKRHDQPDGTFWVDADVADRMLRKNQDSYSLSGFDGYPTKDFTFFDMWR